MRGEREREKNYVYPILDPGVHSLPLFLGMCPHSGASPASFQLYKAGKKCDYYFGLIFNQFSNLIRKMPGTYNYKNNY